MKTWVGLQGEYRKEWKRKLAIAQKWAQTVYNHHGGDSSSKANRFSFRVKLGGREVGPDW